MATVSGKWLSKEGLTYLWSKLKTIFTKQEETNAIANAGAKNQLPITTASTTHKGITFTVNNDETITVNGTNDGTGASIFDVSTQAICGLANGDYILSGCPSNGSTAGYRMDVTRSPGSAIQDTGSGALFTIGGSYTVNQYRIVVNSGVSVDHVVFYPMIRRAEITDATFQPYALPNPTLTPAAIKAVDGGAKNRFLSDKAVGTTETIHGRTFTIQSDGGIKVETTGTVDADADFYLLGVWQNTSALFDAGSKTWIPVCSCTTKSDNISLRIYNRSTGSSVASRTTTSNDNAGKSFDFDLTCAFIKIGSAQTIPSGGIVVYPMICTAHDWNVSQKFVPYAPTNRELYETCETKVTMQQAYGDATLIPANSDLNNYITPGLYYAIVANVPTMANTPYTSTGLRLVVEKNTLSARAVFQTLYPTSRTHLEFYRRVYEGDSWSSWYKFEGTQI